MESCRKRSMVWTFFKVVGAQSVQCLLCRSYFKRIHNSTTNMLRHLRFKHQDETGTSFKGAAENSSGTEAMAEEHHFCSVEVSLEDNDPESISTLNQNAINSILEESQVSPAEVIQVTGISNKTSKYPYRHRRSLIWNYFQVLDGGRAVKCLLCLKILKSCKSGNTSNLRRHISKKHPVTFSEILTNGPQPPLLKISQDISVSDEACEDSNPVKSPGVSNNIEETHEDSRLEKSPQVSNTNGETHKNFRHVKSSQSSKANGKPHETFYATEQEENPGSFKFSGGSESDGLALKREWELIEALRRAQKEEARTLEHQRELLEKLRAADAREAAAERENIELLRKKQQKEAEELSRQREEIEKEKMELEQLRKELVLQN